jgi:hypothetical protein
MKRIAGPPERSGGSGPVLNTYLKVALGLVSLVALGLLGLNFHTAGSTPRSGRWSSASTMSDARKRFARHG